MGPYILLYFFFLLLFFLLAVLLPIYLFAMIVRWPDLSDRLYSSALTLHSNSPNKNVNKSRIKVRGTSKNPTVQTEWREPWNILWGIGETLRESRHSARFSSSSSTYSSSSFSSSYFTFHSCVYFIFNLVIGSVVLAYLFYSPDYVIAERVTQLRRFIVLVGAPHSKNRPSGCAYDWVTMDGMVYIHGWRSVSVRRSTLFYLGFGVSWFRGDATTSPHIYGNSMRMWTVFSSRAVFVVAADATVADVFVLAIKSNSVLDSLYLDMLALSRRYQRCERDATCRMW